jgi:TolA-binding protein
MREPFTKEFLEKYAQSFNLYVQGKWMEAKKGFESVFDIYPEDPLSKKLILFMENNSF